MYSQRPGLTLFSRQAPRRTLQVLNLLAFLRNLTLQICHELAHPILGNTCA
jgi:hypothetical protein